MAEVLEPEVEKGQGRDDAAARHDGARVADEEGAGSVAAEEYDEAGATDDEAAGANEDFTPGKRSRLKSLRKRRTFLVVGAVLLVVALVFGVRYWLWARAHETTDDAFVDADIIAVSPKVSGYVTKVYVKSNQQVKAGDLVAEIDPRDYEARLQQARAALDAGQARLREARTGVELTRANSRASIQQAAATVRQAQTGVESQRAAAAAERTRIAQASSGVVTARANVSQARSQLAAAEAEATRANADVARYQELFAKDEISRQRLDAAIAAARTADAQVAAAQGRVAAAEAQVNEARAAETTAAENARKAQSQVGGAQAGVGEALGRLAQANTAPQQVAVSQAQAETAGATIEQLRSAVEQAELELSYTKIYAPGAGRITNKSVEEGALVQVGQPLMAVVQSDVWVVANFKENQIGRMHVGQHVDISVDAYPGKVFRGHVESLQAGTGSRFSMMPAENATGNYVKVVQRVPVKIVFDDPPDSNYMLAPGMSVVPEVQVT
ncbi:MAG: HlyD family secretion protein [Acidobacteria bacterium]|nr:HlyD family secretion protein [Acidobacteriota bacterium]